MLHICESGNEFIKWNIWTREDWIIEVLVCSLMLLSNCSSELHFLHHLDVTVFQVSILIVFVFYTSCDIIVY